MSDKKTYSIAEILDPSRITRLSLSGEPAPEELEAFHKLFFPGKDNWEFDEDLDEVVKILPENFFALCAAWIGTHVLIFDVSAITYSIKKKKNNKKTPELSDNQENEEIVENEVCNQ